VIVNQQTTREICPLAWKEFQAWLTLPANKEVQKVMARDTDFRVQIGCYYDFFVKYTRQDDDIKRTLMKHSAIDPRDVQKNTLYKLFVQLEALIRRTENWCYRGRLL